VQHGVAVAWLVDLDDRTIMAFQVEVAGVIVHDLEDDRPLPMPAALRGLELRCADVFQLLVTQVAVADPEAEESTLIDLLARAAAGQE